MALDREAPIFPMGDGDGDGLPVSAAAAAEIIRRVPQPRTRRPARLVARLPFTKAGREARANGLKTVESIRNLIIKHADFPYCKNPGPAITWTTGDDGKLTAKGTEASQVRLSDAEFTVHAANALLEELKTIADMPIVYDYFDPSHSAQDVMLVIAGAVKSKCNYFGLSSSDKEKAMQTLDAINKALNVALDEKQKIVPKSGFWARRNPYLQ